MFKVDSDLCLQYILTLGKESSLDKRTTAAMGAITPLLDFDYRQAEPLRVYRFQPKYFITMGMFLLC